jgi:outer membrane protein assembly factor BamB
VTVDWETSIPGTTGGLAIHDGTVYAGTEHGLRTLDIATGDQGWQFSTGQNPISSQPVIADETVFFGTLPFRSERATLYAVTTAGEEEWSVSLPGGVSTSAVANGLVFTASGVMSGGDYGLYAHDVKSGDREWEVPLDAHPVGSSPTVAERAVYIESGGFAAFDAATGELNWHNERANTEVGEAARYAPTVGDGTAYFSHSIEPVVYAFDTATGEKRWMTETNARASQPILDGGTLYVGTTNYSSDDPEGRLYALEATTGDEQWSVATGDVPLQGPVVREGTVYTAGFHTLYAIEAASGEIEWEYQFDNGISAPVSSDDRLVVDTPDPSSSNHRLYALRR